MPSLLEKVFPSTEKMWKLLLRMLSERKNATPPKHMLRWGYLVSPCALVTRSTPTKIR